MKKLLPIVLILFCFRAHGQNTYAFTQENNKAISFGVENLFLRNSSFFKYGFGASVKGEYPLQEGLSLTANAGYNAFLIKNAYKNPTGSTPLATFIPIKAGAKLFIGGGLYFDAEIGGSIETNYEKKKYFDYAVGFGYAIDLKAHRDLDLSFRYEDWGNLAVRFGALRVAYRADWL